MDDSKYYEIDYTFSSYLDDMEPGRYLTAYEGILYELELDRAHKEVIGKFSLSLILFSAAYNDGMNLLDVIDHEAYIYEIANKIYDLETFELDKKILGFDKMDPFHSDTCIITRLEIKESYRGQAFGHKIIRDIYHRFQSSCGLFVVHAFPLQCESQIYAGRLHEHDDWLKQMNYASMEQDYERAFYKLKAFYQKIGFDHIDGFNELMFFCPAFLNERMSSVKLS